MHVTSIARKEMKIGESDVSKERQYRKKVIIVHLILQIYSNDLTTLTFYQFLVVVQVVP